jgi:hypothetical protein
MKCETETSISMTDNEPHGLLGTATHRFPVTLAQESLWYLDQLEPGNPAWNIAVRFRLKGPLDVSTLEKAVNEVVSRHEILRTTFSTESGAPAQVVHSSGTIRLPIEDLSDLSANQRDIEEERRTIAEGERRFNLKSGPLLRARLLRLADRDHILLLTIHHIISDGWSIGVLINELAAHYQDFFDGKSASLPALPVQYADYAVWQNEHSTDAGLGEHRDYWTSKLANLSLCEIPTDRVRPDKKTHNGYILSVVLPNQLADALIDFSRQQNCTFYITSLAALKMLVAHCAMQTNIHVGTLVAGRDRVELESLIGDFINTLVLRTDLSGDPPFTDFLARVKQTVQEAFAHQQLHFQQVVEALRPKRDPSRHPLFSINFIYQRDFVKPLAFAGLMLEPIPSKSPGSIYDLNFFMVRRSDGWRLSCEYNLDLYDASSVARMLGQLQNLLEEIAKNPYRQLSEFTFPQDAVASPAELSSRSQPH